MRLGAKLLAYLAASCLAWPVMKLLAYAPAGSRRLRLAHRITVHMSEWGHALLDPLDDR